MKKKTYTGYAVVNSDFTASSFSHYDLDTCKRYCRDGYKIIRTYRKKIGYSFSFYWGKWYKPFHFSLIWKEMNILWFHVRWDKINTDAWEKKVYWIPELDDDYDIDD